MNKRSTLGWGAVAALALTFIGLTIVFNHSLAGWQLDLTQNRLYTISSGTDRVLQGIKEPIDLYFFYSAKTAQSIPQISPYGQRVHDFLEELAQRSGGMIHLHVIDPQPYSVEEDRAAELGVTGTAINDAGTKFYFGLAGTNSTNGRQAIPFFDPSKQRFLEYDVAKLVFQLSHPAKPVVAWLSTLPMTGGFDPRSGQMRQPWVIYSQAQQLFDVLVERTVPNAFAGAKIDRFETIHRAHEHVVVDRQRVQSRRQAAALLEVLFLHLGQLFFELRIVGRGRRPTTIQ